MSQVDCGDMYSIIIQAILNLGESIGSSVASITAECKLVCPSVESSLSEDTVATSIQSGIKRGLFGLGSESTYMVRSDMVQCNYANTKYYRQPGTVDSFYRC